MRNGFISKRGSLNATSFTFSSINGPLRPVKKATIHGGYFACSYGLRKIGVGLFPENHVMGAAFTQGKRGDQGEAGFFL